MIHSVTTDYTVVDNLAGLLENIQPDSITSRTFYKSDRLKAIMFGFDTGQELSEHTSSHAAIIQIVQGDATITVGDDKYELNAGCWLHMQPRLKHSVYAKTPLTMLLLMLGAD
ncbi:MAG: cupin domain-containing protein [Anaerolineales bacterium]|nr:cupin domain-containing protein [Anaerolineales bacterium]